MSAPTADKLAESVRGFTDAPRTAAVLCDVDGTLAPIVRRAEDARVREEVPPLLGRLARRYLCVACVSGRSAMDVRRLVGVAEIAYVGSHGAELLDPGATKPSRMPAFARWEDPVRRFVSERDSEALRRLHIRVEDKGAIAALHWRGAPSEESAANHLERLAAEAEAAGFATHWGRKVLEVRPPLPVDKGRGIRDLVLRCGARAALYGGDDSTDLDAFDALEELRGSGDLELALKVGVRSEEGPAAITERADLVVDGVEGFISVLTALDRG